MKLAAPLIALAVLAGCSAQDMCIGNANAPLNTFAKLTAETRANVARGYAIGTREVPQTVEERCEVPQPDGSVLVQICPRIVTETETFPVAIDLAAEKAKLASMEQRLSEMTRQRDAAVQACQRAHPE